MSLREYLLPISTGDEPCPKCDDPDQNRDHYRPFQHVDDRIARAAQPAPGDIAPLARHFLERFARENQKNVTDFSREATEALVGYPWPGNVRELENAIERAVVLSRSPIIEADDLPRRSLEAGPMRGESATCAKGTRSP